MTKNLRKRLGEKARELREKAGLTQKDVVSKLNIDQGALSAFENHGKKIGSLEKVNELFETLGYELTVSEKKNFVNVRVATDDLAENQDMIRDLNGSVEPEKQSLWQKLKGKLANFIEHSHLAAEEMRIEAEEMAAENERARSQAPAGGQEYGHERYNHSRLVSPRPEIIPVADRRAGVGLLAFFVSAFLRLRSPHRQKFRRKKIVLAKIASFLLDRK